MGVVRLLGKQQPDKMRTYKLRPITETAEQAREAKGQKGKIAKQILLGIDAHLNGYQVCRKIDAGGLQPVQSFSIDLAAHLVTVQVRVDTRSEEHTSELQSRQY